MEDDLRILNKSGIFLHLSIFLKFKIYAEGIKPQFIIAWNEDYKEALQFKMN